MIAMAGFCGTYFGTIFTQDSERIASIWVVNGVVLGLLLLMPRKTWGASLTALAMSFVCANLLFGDPIHQAIGLASGNALEILIGAFAMNRLFGSDRAKASRPWLLRLAVFAGLAACAVSASVASFILSASATRFVDVFATYFPAHLIGVITLTPIVVILLGARTKHSISDVRAGLPLVIVSTAALTFALFAQNTIPLIFLAFPMLIFAAFRAGLAGTAAALFVFTCVATAMTVRGYGPLALVDDNEQMQVLFLQFLVLVANLTIMPIAFALSDRTQAFAAQERLVRAAQEASAAKGQFLANMSHEIRTPLNGILGFSELLGQSELNGRQAHQIGLIHRSAASLLQLLNDILDFSKIEAGHMVVVKEPLDLKSRIFDCVSLVEPLADAKNLEIAVSIDPDLPEAIEGDNLRFRQILLNLLGNAIKFSDEGTLSVTAERDPDGQLSLRVEDNGIGIAPDRLKKIFEEFVQAEDNTAQQFGGTGLGLSISQKLAQLMGGEIALQSELGKGTVARVTLPMVAVEAAPRPDIAQPTVTRLQPARLLVVDDLDINREVIRAMLEGMGHHVVEACDGQEALNAIEEAERSGDLFAGVLMDVRMPVMDGLEATRSIKRERIQSKLACYRSDSQFQFA